MRAELGGSKNKWDSQRCLCVYINMGADDQGHLYGSVEFSVRSKDAMRRCKSKSYFSCWMSAGSKDRMQALCAATSGAKRRKGG